MNAIWEGALYGFGNCFLDGLGDDGVLAVVFRVRFADAEVGGVLGGLVADLCGGRGLVAVGGIARRWEAERGD